MVRASPSDAPVRAALWDADGVLQRPAEGWVTEYEAFGGVPEGFFEDVWAAEVPLLAGGDFPAAVAAVAARHGVEAPVEALLSRWRAVRPVDDALEVVGELRRSGVRCFLATNQNGYRCTWMREHLGYDGILDGAFYSCELGAAKPTAGFFHAILSRLDLTAEQVGFVDDSAGNVDAAHDLGIRSHRWHHDDGVPELRRIAAELAGRPR